MRLFPRQPALPPTPAAAPAPVPALPPPPPPPIQGFEPFTEVAGTPIAALQCAYVDAHEVQCPARVRISMAQPGTGAVYCRRHASALNAIYGLSIPSSVTSAVGGELQIPDLHDRSPALVDWVTRDLHAHVTDLLGQAARGLGGHVVVEPVRPTIDRVGAGRSRRWQRDWKLIDHTGVLLRVSICVDRRRDSEVVVVVDGQEMARVVPPWIADRLDPQARSVAARGGFYEVLLQAVREGIDRSLALRGVAPTHIVRIAS